MRLVRRHTALEQVDLYSAVSAPSCPGDPGDGEQRVAIKALQYFAAALLTCTPRASFGGNRGNFTDCLFGVR
jgi:hypothetical protein